MYKKKRWITKIPQILTFNIIRVVYDHKTNMPTKLHNEFSFDKEIYIDRFIAENALRFPDFMNTLDSLKAKKQALEETLKKYQHQSKDLLYTGMPNCSVQFKSLIAEFPFSMSLTVLAFNQ